MIHTLTLGPMTIQSASELEQIGQAKGRASRRVHIPADRDQGFHRDVIADSGAT